MVLNQDGYLKVPGGKIWYQRTGSSEGIPLLTLHGGPGYPHNYLKPLVQLSDKQPIIFYDQLGCGKSDRPSNPDLWTIERFCQEIEILREALNLEKIHLFGHSWGTMLATDYMLTKPKGVVSLILASPVLSVNLWMKAWNFYRQQLPQPIQDNLDQHENDGTIESLEYLTAVAAFYQYHVLRLYPKPFSVIESELGFGKEVYNTMWGPNEFNCTGTLNDYDRTTQANLIMVPTLITCGRFDGASPEACQYYKSLIPNAKLEIFEQSSHNPHFEEMEKYISVLKDFLSQQHNI